MFSRSKQPAAAPPAPAPAAAPRDGDGGGARDAYDAAFGTSAAKGEFGQLSPLTTTLRNVLRDYSGAQLLNEMLQNADDAGAREFKVLLDARAFGAAPPLRGHLSAAHARESAGPALLAFDDAEFAPDDFVSIQRVGDGTKRGDPTRPGQFGLGFNAVYHVTDLPSFISGRHDVVRENSCACRASPTRPSASVTAIATPRCKKNSVCQVLLRLIELRCATPAPA